MIAAFHIAIAMKPCEGTFAENALKHGVAGLAIDACRIGWDSKSLANDTKRRNTPRTDITNGRMASGAGAEAGGYIGNAESPSGRFPANLILSHSPACECVGTKKVKGSFIEKPCPNPEIRGHKWGTIQGNRGARGHGDKDGTETIQDWKCVDGCPVKEFPISSVTGKRSDRSRVSVVKGTQWLSDNHKSTEYTDSGTAARFFIR